MVSFDFAGSRILAALMLTATGMVGAQSGDDYLSQLDAEVQKVEVRQIDGAAGTNEVVAPSALGSPVSVSGGKLPRNEFDDMLRVEHKGIFTFYKLLPERSKQEVYSEYVRGASTQELRTKTLDRFKQR